MFSSTTKSAILFSKLNFVHKCIKLDTLKNYQFAMFPQKYWNFDGFEIHIKIKPKETKRNDITLVLFTNLIHDM